VVSVEGCSYEELGVGEILSLRLDIGCFPHCNDSEVKIASHIRKVLGIIADTSSKISSNYHPFDSLKSTARCFEVSLQTTLILRLRKDTGDCSPNTKLFYKLGNWLISSTSLMQSEAISSAKVS
jgi:hypothetical protein